MGEAEQLCRNTPSLLSFVMLHGISELEFGWTAVEKALEDAKYAKSDIDEVVLVGGSTRIPKVKKSSHYSLTLCPGSNPLTLL